MSCFWETVGEFLLTWDKFRKKTPIHAIFSSRILIEEFNGLVLPNSVSRNKYQDIGTGGVGWDPFGNNQLCGLIDYHDTRQFSNCNINHKLTQESKSSIYNICIILRTLNFRMGISTIIWWWWLCKNLFRIFRWEEINNILFGYLLLFFQTFNNVKKHLEAVFLNKCGLH